MRFPRLNRVGPWIFVVALLGYIISCYLGNELDKKNLLVTKEKHEARQTVDVNSITDVVIRVSNTKDGQYYRTINVVFDSKIRDVMVTNTDMSLLIQHDKSGATLTFTLEKIASRRHDQSGTEVEIRLPVSLRTVKFDNVSGAEIAGDASSGPGPLNLIILGDRPNIDIERLTVDQLSLAVQETDFPCECNNCRPTFKIEADARIVSGLEVSMPRGNFEYLSFRVPSRVHLKVGDPVRLEGYRPLFQTATIDGF